MNPVDDTAASPFAQPAFIGALSGVLAGIAYLGAQVTFAVTVGQGPWALPLQRIAAILLGDDVLVPAGEMSIPVFAMALFIHLVLCIAYGRFVGFVVRGRALPQALLLGAGVGVAIFGVNFWLVAPEAFPWFADSRTLTTFADHVLFGVVAALAYARLRPLAGTHLAAGKQIT